MSDADIIQIILSILSLLSTIAISVVIYRLDRKREKRIKKETLTYDIKKFIIDNDEELDYLPLCIIVASIHPYSPHTRLIYNAFNRCYIELQHGIIKYKNIPIGISNLKPFVNVHLSSFIEFEQKYSMGQSILYDNGKYFHRSIDQYAKEKIDNPDPYCFEVPCLSPILKSFNHDQNIKTNLNGYIDRYLEYILRDRADTANSPEFLVEKPPMDLLCSKFMLGSCPEKELCFWIMRYIVSSCQAFKSHHLTDGCQENWRNLDIDLCIIETYEDMYYYTILILLTTFGKDEVIALTQNIQAPS